MILKNRILELINEATFKGTTKTQPLINAIKNRNPITFYYSGPIKPKSEEIFTILPPLGFFEISYP